MKYIIFSLLIFSSFNIFAKNIIGNFSIEKAKITYHVDFLLKHVKGTSNKVKGKAVCKNKKCQFLIAVPSKSFISKDSNRDSNMLGVIKSGSFPMVVLRAETGVNLTNSSQYNLDLSFAGQKHLYKNVSLKLIHTKQSLKFTGHFIIKLSDFKIERPSLLLVKINDKVKIDVDVNFKKK